MKKLAALLLLIASAAVAQNGSALPYTKLQFFGPDGKPLSNGWVYTYAAGTSIPQTTYTDPTKGTPNGNPYHLDASGYGAMFIGPLSYKVVLCKGGNGGTSDCSTSGGVVVWTQDLIADAGQLLRAALIGTNGASNVTVTQSGTGAVNRSAQSKLNELACSVVDFGADPTGANDSLAAFNLAKAACPHIFVPDGTFSLSGMFSINQSNFTMSCASQNSILKYTGTGAVAGVVFVGPDSPFDVHIQNCTIKGDSAGNATTALNLSKANSSTFDHIQLKDAKTCLGHYGGVGNTIKDVSCSVNNGGFLYRPTRGFDFGPRPDDATQSGTTATIIRPIIEGVYGEGMYFRKSESILILGGISEANISGVVLADTTANNVTMMGLGLEVNCLILSGGNYILNDGGACPGKYTGTTPHDVGVIDAGFQTEFTAGGYVTGYYHVTTSQSGDGTHARGTKVSDVKMDVIMMDPTVEDTFIEHNNMEITGTKIPGILTNGDATFPFGINTTILANYRSNGGAIVAVEQTIPGSLFLNTPLTIIPDSSDVSRLQLLGRDRVNHGLRFSMGEAANLYAFEVLDTTANANWNKFLTTSKVSGGMQTDLWSTISAGSPILRFSAVPGGSILISSITGTQPLNDAADAVVVEGALKATYFDLIPVVFSSLVAKTGRQACITDSTTQVWGANVTGGGALFACIEYNGANWTVKGK